MRVCIHDRWNGQEFQELFTCRRARAPDSAPTGSCFCPLYCVGSDTCGRDNAASHCFEPDRCSGSPLVLHRQPASRLAGGGSAVRWQGRLHSCVPQFSRYHFIPQATRSKS